MRNSFSLPLLFLTSLVFSCGPGKIRLSADFERGCLGNYEEISPGHFRIHSKHWHKRDSIGDQYYWFYFRADHVKGKKLTVELTDLVGVYRGNPHIVYTDYTEPVYSYDQAAWERITDVGYDSTQHIFTFSGQFEREPVWIAFGHPYTVTRLQELINKMSGVPCASVITLAKTAENRSISMFHMTDRSIPDTGKKTILIMAAQHAGEDAGAFMAEGLVNFLSSDSSDAKEIRKSFDYYVIPLMNPDGFYHGITRYNTNMEDLNNIWNSDSLSQPEVTGVKNWIDSMMQAGRKIDLFIDLHNHTQFYRYHVYIFQDNSLDSLASISARYWPVISWHSDFQGSSCAWMLKKGIPNCTIELTQGRIGDGSYLTIDDYHFYGRGTALAIRDYFNIKSSGKTK